MNERIKSISRKTAETDINLTLALDGSGKADVDTGNGFFDHMLTLFAHHSGFDLTVSCKGDIYCDFHHSCEDIGIVLGTALREALGDKRGIFRYADIILPMDEALVMAAVDISGRSYFCGELKIPSQRIGDFDTELITEFFKAFSSNVGITLHLRQIAGENSHHIVEACFKASARVIAQAARVDIKNSDRIPSSKGLL